jgi:hypothetical protein
MSSNPKPRDGVAMTFSNGPILLSNPDGPEVLVTAELFKPKRWMIGGFGK